MKKFFAIVFICALFAALSCFGVSAATGENVTNEMTIERLANFYVASTLNFSKVFPEWKIPTEDFSVEKVSGIEGGTATSSTYVSAFKALPTSTMDELVLYNAYDVYMFDATDEQAEPFAKIQADPYTLGTAIRTVVEMLGASETCNIGYSDATTGQFIAYATNLTAGQYVDLS